MGHSDRCAQHGRVAADDHSRREIPMEPAEFAQRLSALTGPEITALAARLRHELDSADGELSWWRATVTVGANLKRHHRTREAGIAAHRATTAILRAAEH